MSGHMCKVAYQTEKLQYWYDGYSDSLTETHFSEEGNCLHGMRMFLPTALIGVLEVAGDRITAFLRTSLQQLRDREVGGTESVN